jgi:uncharacterized protein with HEPN domain/predicted nucleotidyltransferase
MQQPSMITAQQGVIAELCRRFQVERLEVFGSATRTDFDPERSDVEFLVSFLPGATEIDGFLGLAEGLEAAMDRRVDLAVSGPSVTLIFGRLSRTRGGWSMHTHTKKLLFDILQACGEVEKFTAGITLESYSASTMHRAATERLFELIGEAMTRLRDKDDEVFMRVPGAHGIIGFRNRLIHGYDAVDDEIVWRIIQERVPTLLMKCELSSRRLVLSRSDGADCAMKHSPYRDHSRSELVG